MRPELRARCAGALACLAIAGCVVVLAWAPSYLAFAASMALAIAWCVWLERHPAP